MKVKTLKRFRDAHTGDIHEVGDEFDVTQDRLDEILAVGNFVKKVAARRRKTAEKADE